MTAEADIWAGLRRDGVYLRTGVVGWISNDEFDRQGVQRTRLSMRLEHVARDYYRGDRIIAIQATELTILLPPWRDMMRPMLRCHLLKKADAPPRPRMFGPGGRV